MPSESGVAELKQRKRQQKKLDGEDDRSNKSELEEGSASARAQPDLGTPAGVSTPYERQQPETGGSGDEETIGRLQVTPAEGWEQNMTSCLPCDTPNAKGEGGPDATDNQQHILLREANTKLKLQRNKELIEEQQLVEKLRKEAEKRKVRLARKSAALERVRLDAAAMDREWELQKATDEEFLRQRSAEKERKSREGRSGRLAREAMYSPAPQISSRAGRNMRPRSTLGVRKVTTSNGSKLKSGRGSRIFSSSDESDVVLILKNTLALAHTVIAPEAVSVAERARRHGQEAET